jgi:O-antigen ligase
MNLTKINKIIKDIFISEKIFLYFYLLIPTIIMFSKFFAETIIVILILFILLNLFKKKQFNNIFIWDPKNNLLKIANAFLIFFIFIFFNKIINFSNIYDLSKSFSLLRFSIFLLIPLIFINIKNVKFHKNLFYFIIIPTLVLNIDLIYQFYSSKNILGYGYDSGYKRSSSFFGDEKIAGSYLYFNFFILLLLFNFYKYKKFIISLILLTYYAIYLSGDRQPFLLVNISLIIFLFIFFKEIKLNFIKNKIKYLFIILLILILSFNYNFKKVIMTEKYVGTLNQIKEFDFKNTHYYYHFNKAIIIFKSNIIFGTGYKTFRVECSSEKYKDTLDKSSPGYFNGCATHPHNYYLEIMSENGTTGLLLFIFIIYTFYKIFINTIYYQKKEIFINKIMLTFIFTFFFPFKPTGSFYTNFNLIMLFFVITFFFFLTSINKKKIE